ncbi:hypothetical protein [Intestinibacillus massiliensis]|uniref:hypothetical protein n=1 Tax=Intestinibacillus massiliensis TaxID=1871029 RepID=UPI000B360A43|nr:hypothetical protein [Intestinibacillus massiliensis]
MKHKIVFILLSFVVLASSVICYDKLNTDNGQKTNEYLSFTVYDSLGVNQIEGTICKYDLQSKEVSERFKFPISAMYALGVYDEKTNSVYYCNENDNHSFERKHTGGDQLYVHNLTTGSDRKLTDDLVAVNDIIPVDDILFVLVSRPQNSHSVALGKIDLSDGSIQYWDEPYETSSRLLSIDRVQKRLYVAIYDEEEEYASILANSIVPPTYTIYSYDYNLGDKRKILCEENKLIRSVYTTDNLMLYSIGDALTQSCTTHTFTRLIDLNTMDTLLETDDSFPEDGCLSTDKKGAYFLGTLNDFEGIIYYDFETQEYTPVVKSDYGAIANFELISEDK